MIKTLPWADIYGNDDIETKRLVAAYIIKRVTIRKGNGMEVELRISKAQFEKGL